MPGGVDIGIDLDRPERLQYLLNSAVWEINEAVTTRCC